MNKQHHNKSWCAVKGKQTVTVAGALKTFQIIPKTFLATVLRATDATSEKSLKKALRVAVRGEKVFSKEYTRMKKCVCYIVKCSNGNIKEVSYFVVNSNTDCVFAVAKKSTYMNKAG